MNSNKDISNLQKIIYKLVKKGDLVSKGSKTYRTYSLAEKKRN